VTIVLAVLTTVLASLVVVPSRRADWTGPISAEAVGTLVAFYDTHAFKQRRYTIVQRLRALRDSAAFETLPEDLRQRVREIVDQAEL
jgi:hypothetical protein